MSETWSVSNLNRYVRQALAADYRLQNLRVAGEISGFRAYPSGHWYFSLKDAAAQVQCVMWRSRAEKQQARFLPRDGDAVLIHGDVTLYEARGQYQLDATWIEPAGEGELYRAFIQLKAQLEAEGLFAAERKRPLPKRPRLIGLVTSPAGAALRDMLNVLRRRLPLARVVLSPAAVQGEAAPAQIVAALGALAAVQPDVILVARGGGSLEDLWAFNDERVARAIAAAPAPVISGVGHETDFTIADFVADLRAPTPSAAAELATPVTLDDLRDGVDQLTVRLARACSGQLSERRLALAQVRARLQANSPRARLAAARQSVWGLRGRLGAAMLYRLRLEGERLGGLTQALNAVSPLNVLQRGYAILTRPDGRVVRHAQEVRPGDRLRAQVAEGEFEVQVESRKEAE